MRSDAPSGSLVVVGSSAGGIEALSILVGSLRPEFPAPVVLAQHLDPTRPSHLASVLERRPLPPHRQEREAIFDRLHQASLPQAGLPPRAGLGLFIARELVEQHGGDLGVASEVGKGSLFTIRMPVQGEG